MIRVVLDANVLAPAFVNRAASAGRLRVHWQNGEFEPIVPAPILAELHRALAGPDYAWRASPHWVETALAVLESNAIVVIPAVSVSGVATYPEDDFVLATAVAGSADCLATRDQQFLKLGTYRGVPIVHPADLAAHLDQLLGP